MRYIFKINLLIVSLFIFSCTGENQDIQQINSTEIIINEDLNASAKGGFICHSFTVGISWPLTLETQIHYCCIGDSLCLPSVGVSCINCGIVSDTTYEEINTSLKIHVSDIDPKILSDKVIISKSSEIEFENHFYKIKCQEYIVDKDGFITLEFEKK